MNQFSEYREKDEEIKPIARIGNFGLVKYRKKEKEGEAKDLFGNAVPEKKDRKYVRKGPGERNTVLKEIKDIMDLESKQQKKPPVNTRLFAIRLSHVPTKDLYWMKSEGLDYRNRKKGPFSKYIMGAPKPKKDLTEKI